MKKAIFEIIVCPSCNGKLKLTMSGQALVCTFDKLVFSINDGIPNMLLESAEKISDEKIQQLEFR